MTVHELWEQAAPLLVPPTGSELQHDMTRDAFYHGVVSILLAAQREALSVERERMVDVLHAWVHEIADYFDPPEGAP